MREVLASKVPAEALEYCVKLWDERPFRFRLSRSRSSKLGDYRFHPKSGMHTVTVNTDLNPYQFLITYVHEVAHRWVHDPSKRQKPHGIVWKRAFQQLMLPLLRPEVFPDDVLRVLAKHMKNPKASTSADPLLLSTLSQYDTERASRLTLKNIGLQETFVFRKRSFQKLEEKRTRALCLDLSNRKRYLIPMVAEVGPPPTPPHGGGD